MEHQEPQSHPLGAQVELRPYEGLGPFQFGMFREEVAEIIEAAGLEFMVKTYETVHDAHILHTDGMAVEFSPHSGEADHVMVYPGDSPLVVVAGVLLQGGFNNIITDLTKAGHQPVPLDHPLLPSDLWACWDLGLTLMSSDDHDGFKEIRAIRARSLMDLGDQ